MKPFPQFTIERICGADCFGTFEASKWVGENWAVCLMHGDRFIWGRFVEVDQIRRSAGFRADAPAEIAGLSAGDRLALLDGYWGHQVELVSTPSHVWRFARFVARDAVEFQVESGRLRTAATPGLRGAGVPGGWDHEHCELCNETISEHGVASGWTNEEGNWLCEACYATHVLQGSLEFVNVE
jgi:hypothetical protein